MIPSTLNDPQICLTAGCWLKLSPFLRQKSIGWLSHVIKRYVTWMASGSRKNTETLWKRLFLLFLHFQLFYMFILYWLFSSSSPSSSLSSYLLSLLSDFSLFLGDKTKTHKGWHVVKLQPNQSNLIFPRKQDLTVHITCLQWRQIALNDKSVFLENKKEETVVCWNSQSLVKVNIAWLNPFIHANQSYLCKQNRSWWDDLLPDLL